MTRPDRFLRPFAGAWRRRALIPACLLLPACTAAPTFVVTDVAMTAESEEAYVLTFTLEGENTNKDPLPLRHVSYHLTLEDQRVFTGRRSAQVTLPAHGSETISLPVSIPAEGGPPPGGATATDRIAGSIEYIGPGSIAELLFDSRIRVPKTDFGESGAFEFSE